MFRITRAYKEGRAVLYYDMVDTKDNSKRDKVHKDEVVKLSENGQIKDCRIQWWEGKPIVRLSDKDIPIVKIEGGQAVDVKRTVRNDKAVEVKESVKVEEEIIDISSKAVVVGKLATKKPKLDIGFGYDKSNMTDAQNLKSTVNKKEFSTLNDLFNQMVKEFNLRDVEVYRKEISKKISLNRIVANIPSIEYLNIQDRMCLYLSNMAYKEINETYIKYRVMQMY